MSSRARMTSAPPLALSLVLALTLAGCAAGSEGTGTVAATSQTSSEASSSSGAATPAGSAPAASAAAAPDASPAAAPAAGRYLDHATYRADPGRYADGDVVLFFHAPWCPTCRATEKSLTEDGVPAGLTVVKVDYDGEQDLRRRYRVTHQHTFVAVDADGGARGTWSGSITGQDIKAEADAV